MMPSGVVEMMETLAFQVLVETVQQLLVGTATVVVLDTMD